MKSINPIVAIFCLMLLTTLSSCQAIGSIFKAGVWTGVILVIAAIALVIFIASRKSEK